MSKYAIPTVNPNIVYAMENQRKPWKVLLEFRGRNKRTGGWSEKWWSLEGDGSGTVKVNHGKVGSHGRRQPFVFDFAKGFDTMTKKLSDGYQTAAGSMSKMPALDDKTKHADLPGVYRDIRFITSPQPNVFIACAEDGSEVCRLTAAGALRLASVSSLITARTDESVMSTLEAIAQTA